jgi:hypothetical protein
VKDLYNRNYVTLKRENKKVTGKWKDLSYSWIGRINIVKMAMLLRAIYRFNKIPLNFPQSFLLAFFTGIERLTL